MSIPPASPDIHALWRNAQAVCFDIDSTVCLDEGIDMLAAHAGVGDQVAAMTSAAMGGTVLFQRLDLIRPSRSMVADCLRAHPPRLTPGILDLVNALTRRRVAVYLITGGFTHMAEPVLKKLGLPRTQLIANTLLFAADGSFAGFDTAALTARSGGKGAAISDLKNRFGYAPLIMVGDGVTDLEARPPADGFIGFGGVVVRDRVKAQADWFVLDFQDLQAELDRSPPARRRSSTAG